MTNVALRTLTYPVLRFVLQDLGIFSPKFLRERRKSFVHRVFSIRSITPGRKVLAFILGLKLAPTSNGRAMEGIFSPKPKLHAVFRFKTLVTLKN